MGDVRKRRVDWPLLFASAFDNGLADRKSAFNMFSGNNQGTSRPNFVNFRQVISEFTVLKRAIFVAIRLQFDDDLHLSRWRFQTDWKIAILIPAEQSAVISVHLIEIWWDSVQWPRSLRHKKLYSLPRREWPLLFALAFDNGLADHKSAFNGFNGNKTIFGDQLRDVNCVGGR